MPIKKKKAPSRKTPIRQRILQTATKLFYAHGIQAVGVDRIVAEAKIAKMTLYNYFPSKDDLVEEYLKTSADNWLKKYHQYLNAHFKTDLERLTGTFEYLKVLYLKEKQFRGSILINAELELSDPSLPIHGITLDFQESLRTSFENWAYNSELSDARELSYSLIMLYQGAIVTAMTEDFPEPLNHALKTAQALIDSKE